MRAPASRRLDSRLAPVAQLAEATDLKSVCCGFESHRGYYPRGTDEAVAGARLSVPRVDPQFRCAHNGMFPTVGVPRATLEAMHH